MMRRKGIAETLGMDRASLQGARQVCGSFDASALTIGLVASRFNTELTTAAVKAALTCLIDQGASPERLTVVWVPGAFEIPTALALLAATDDFDALIGLGAVVEGATPHASAIQATVTQAIGEIARQYRLPVIDGVVVARTMEQAEERCLSNEHSRAWYAARAAIEMAHVVHQLKAD